MAFTFSSFRTVDNGGKPAYMVIVRGDTVEDYLEAKEWAEANIKAHRIRDNPSWGPAQPKSGLMFLSAADAAIIKLTFGNT